MNDVGTALREAAQRVTPAPVAPEALWQQGRRRVRRRRVVASALAAAVVALVVGVGGSLSLVDGRQEAPPLGPAGEMRLPDRFFQPSEVLKPRAEPPGRLVAVLGAPLRSAEHGMGLVGVTAETGEYRALEAPGYDALAETPVALSADGRYVAWWRTDPGLPVGNAGSPPHTGLVVYDAVTGSVLTHRPQAPHGLDGQELVWTDAGLWFNYYAWDDAGGDGGTSTGTMFWDLDSEPHPAGPGRQFHNLSGATGRGADLVLRFEEDGKSELRWVRPDGVRRAATFRADLTGGLAVSAEGSVAALRDSDGESVAGDSPYPLLVGRVLDGAVTFREVPGVDADEVLGWRDADHVVVRRWKQSPQGYVSVDVRDGGMELLSTPVSQNFAPGSVVAADAWQAPVYDAREPDWPVDTRPFIIAGLVLACAAGIGLLWWRRRG